MKKIDIKGPEKQDEIRQDAKGALRWQDFCDELFLVNVLESIHDAVDVIDAEGRIVYVNPAYTRELGVPSRKIVGKKMKDIAPEAVSLKVLESGQPLVEQPHRIVGLGLDIVVSATPLYKNGVLIGVTSVFKNVTEIKRLNEELERMRYFADYLQEQLALQQDLPEGFKNIVGSSKNFRDTVSRAMKASRSEITVLLLGETGTGKDLIARSIHSASKRQRGPLIEINCAAIPENLLESELFGFEEGSFTGARKGGKAGKFELAHGGTLFLDEIGDMSPVLQAKLLHALQEKQIERVGGMKKIRTDVRIIAATNLDLEAKIKENKFRADLFYRLNVFNINMPSLRARKDDIPLLSVHFLKKFAEREGKNVKLSASALNALMLYHWPGNIRELQNAIESAIVSCEREYIEPEDFPEYMQSMISPHDPAGNCLVDDDGSDLDSQISRLEREQILKALEKSGNNRSRAIRILGISRSTFYERIARYGIKLS